MKNLSNTEIYNDILGLKKRFVFIETPDSEPQKVSQTIDDQSYNPDEALQSIDNSTLDKSTKDIRENGENWYSGMVNSFNRVVENTSKFLKENNAPMKEKIARRMEEKSKETVALREEIAAKKALLKARPTKETLMAQFEKTEKIDKDIQKATEELVTALRTALGSVDGNIVRLAEYYGVGKGNINLLRTNGNIRDGIITIASVIVGIRPSTINAKKFQSTVGAYYDIKGKTEI